MFETVITFCANPANNLTCSPSYYYILIKLKIAEVPKHACGQSDVLVLDQPKLIFERGAAALARSQRLAACTTTSERDCGDLRPFGARGVVHEAMRSGALSVATTDPLDGGLVRRPWDTSGREYVDETYHRLLHGIAAEWEPEVDGDLTFDPLVIQLLAESFEVRVLRDYLPLQYISCEPFVLPISTRSPPHMFGHVAP